MDLVLLYVELHVAHWAWAVKEVQHRAGHSWMLGLYLAQPDHSRSEMGEATCYQLFCTCCRYFIVSSAGGFGLGADNNFTVSQPSICIQLCPCSEPPASVPVTVQLRWHGRRRRFTRGWLLSVRGQPCSRDGQGAGAEPGSFWLGQAPRRWLRRATPRHATPRHAAVRCQTLSLPQTSCVSLRFAASLGSRVLGACGQGALRAAAAAR